MELFDNHAHYDDKKFDEDRDEIIKQIYNSGVTKVISAGYSIESSLKAIELSEKYDFIYAICGVSPNDISDGKDKIDEDVEKLKNIINNRKNNKIVAIGEIGLDYYWNTDNKDLQKYAFIKQIELANSLNLPIVIHTRDAIMDTLDIIKNVVKPVKPGVFHCCPLNVELVKEALKLGFYISFAGPVTFKNSKNAAQVVQSVPLDKILIETDSPYLSPEPKRGQRNDSRNVKFIAEKIAEFKGIQTEEVAEKTYNNAKNVFGII